MFNGKYGKAVAIFSPISSPSQRPKGEILTGLLILWGQRCRSIQHRHGRCDCKTKSDLLIWLIWPWKYAHPYIYIHTLYYTIMYIYIYTHAHTVDMSHKNVLCLFLAWQHMTSTETAFMSFMVTWSTVAVAQ
jgi:hypothetical protein